MPPANRVKWLTSKEQHQLFNYLGGPADEEPYEGGDEPPSWQGGLPGGERLDLAFELTLLRADVFGAVQASIIARLRKRVSAKEAIAQATVAVDDDAYAASAAAYAELRERLHLELLAALAVPAAASPGQITVSGVLPDLAKVEVDSPHVYDYTFTSAPTTARS